MQQSIAALAHFGIPAITSEEKHGWRDLVMRGGPWSDKERVGILDYCQTDVDVMAPLLAAMLPHIDVPRALLRGRYMAAVASIERAGVPIDTELRAMMLGGQAPVVLDVRSHTAFAVDPRTIPTALHVPPDEVKTRLVDIARDGDVILYCNCPNEATAARIAKLLIDQGFARVRPLRGGLDGWISAGPVERVAIEMVAPAALVPML